MSYVLALLVACLTAAFVPLVLPFEALALVRHLAKMSYLCPCSKQDYLDGFLQPVSVRSVLVSEVRSIRCTGMCHDQHERSSDSRHQLIVTNGYGGTYNSLSPVFEIGLVAPTRHKTCPRIQIAAANVGCGHDSRYRRRPMSADRVTLLW
jgi:hypothetical protein